MFCVYCGKETKGSREHIISNAVLDLFPECFATFDEVRKKVYASDPVVKDVCAHCNSQISYIDTFAKNIIQKYFLKKYDYNDELKFDYDYTLMQKMCVKYAFNDCRAHKADTSPFEKGITNWLLNEDDNSSRRNITIMAGLAVNTSPVPDYVFGNRKIRWGKDPVFLENSILRYVDYTTGRPIVRESLKEQEFPHKALSYLFRFNSLQLIMIFWDYDITNEDLEANNLLLGVQYPYTILDNSGSAVLNRCTSETTYHLDNLIDTRWGQGAFDELSYMHGTFSEDRQKFLKDIEQKWEEEEKRLAEEHPRKR